MRKAIVFILVLCADLAIKHFVAYNIPIMQPFAGYPFNGFGVFSTKFLTFSIVHTTNTGAAWSLLANHQGILTAVRLLVTMGIIGYLIFGKPRRYMLYPLTLIAAGALGNIIDTFLYGHVIDMFYFIIYRYSYPVFNVADAVIFSSVAYIFYGAAREKRNRKRHVSSS